MSTKKSNDRKFSKTRSWALNWAPVAQPAPQKSVELPTEAEPGDVGTRQEKSGRTFPEPQGWACNWDTGSMDEGAVSAEQDKPTDPAKR